MGNRVTAVMLGSAAERPGYRAHQEHQAEECKYYGAHLSSNSPEPAFARSRRPQETDFKRTHPDPFASSEQQKGDPGKQQGRR